MNIYYSKKYSEKENNTTLIQNGLSYSTSLLKRVLELIGCKGELKRNSHDKPYIAGIPGLNISVTHTGNLWVCVADIEAVGIDAEYYDRRIGNMERLAKR